MRRIKSSIKDGKVAKHDKDCLKIFLLPSTSLIIIQIFGDSKSSHQGCFLKKHVLKISQYSQENTWVGVSFWKDFIKKKNFIKRKTPTQLFSCKYCEILKIEEYLQTAVSEVLLKESPPTKVDCFLVSISDLKVD